MNRDHVVPAGSVNWLRRVVLGLAWAGLAVATPARADDWIEVKSPYFTVVSEASESRTRAWAVQFELFRQAMQTLMPMPPGAVEPVTLVLFRSDRRLRPFKPVEHGKPAKMSGYFSRALGRNVIALAIDGDWEIVQQVVCHEGVHWHMAGAARDLPRWMEEGLAEVFGNFEIAGNEFIVGKPRPDYRTNVRVMKPMPMATLMTREQLAYNGKHGRETKLFYYQSWAMMHALLFAPDGMGYANFAKFLNQTPGSDDPVKELELGLGRSAADLQRMLETHLERSRVNYLRVKFDRKSVEANFKARPLAAGEADLVLGGLLLCVNQLEEARAYLLRAEAALPDDPRTAESWALLNLAQGDMDGMERQFRTAFRRGSESYVGHYLLALQEWQAAGRSVAGEVGITKAVDEYLACLRLRPQFVPAMEDLASIVTYLPERSVQAEVMVRFAALRHPRNFRIVGGLALLDATYGTLDEAQATWVRLNKLPGQDDPVSRQLLAAVKAKMQLRESDRPKPLDELFQSR